MQVLRITKTFLLILGLSLLQACYYDVEEELYPSDNSNCDTSNITLSGVVRPILENRCITCHNAGFSSGGVDLDTYNELARWANNGKLLSSIVHDGNASAMPKGSPKLDDCKIQQIKLWIEQGAKND